MAGFPGSGKSTIAEEIRKSTNAIVVDRDVIKSSMIKMGIKDPLLTDTSYTILFDLAEHYLSKGVSVIIDTSCYLEETLSKGLSLAEKYEVDYKYIECRVDSYEDIEKRIKTRENKESQMRETTIDKFKSLRDKSIRPEDTDILMLNITSKESYKLEDILDYLYKK